MIFRYDLLILTVFDVFLDAFINKDLCEVVIVLSNVKSFPGSEGVTQGLVVVV
jgi:hypothetical protein